MNSFNHYALGSCGEYFFGYIGGIRPLSPGFKTILIAPVIRDGLTWADTRFNSVQGQIATAWRVKDKRLVLDVVVPANSTARVCVPTVSRDGITEGGKLVGNSQEVRFLSQDGASAIFEVGSGHYRFASQIKP
jgi:alpha-L-rhamnosidase